MVMIDTHTHIYGKQFDNDKAAMMQRAFDAGVEKFYLPAIDSEVIERMMEMETAYPGKCFAMMGLHPTSVNENYKAELAVVENWLIKRKFPAIGEIGLDFYWDKTFTAQQYDAFHFQIQLALRYELPIVIHTRNAMRETIDVVKEYTSRGLRGIFHCFSGTYDEAIEIIDAGFYLGIGGVVTYKNGGLAEVIERIPLQHIVLETDAPYLTPVPFRGKRNESSYLKYIAEKLAGLYNSPVETIASITSENAAKIFKY
jgi:TatD DNase family protein